MFKGPMCGVQKSLFLFDPGIILVYSQQSASMSKNLRNIFQSLLTL